MSERSWRVEALGIPNFSKAMGANTQRPSKSTSLLDAASSAAAPASRAAAETYESAKGQMTVTFQQTALPFCQGTRESLSGRFQSERNKPVGSLTTGTPAAEKLRAIKSFKAWCLMPGVFLQTKIWRPRASTVEPLRHLCGEHKYSPSRRPTVTLNASASNFRPHEAIGKGQSIIFYFYFSTLGSIDPEGLDHPIMSYFPDTVSVCYYFFKPSVGREEGGREFKN